MLNSKNISVVVQGSVDSIDTNKCILSIRRYFPDSEIILSTWEGANFSNLDYDVLVENKDPGESDRIRLYPFEHTNNVNRQIVSTKNGILKTSREYVLKIRSDMIIKNANLINYYKTFGEIKTKNTVFKRRIAVNANTTISESVFNVGDWWSFGLKEDMLTLWDIPLYSEKKGKEFFLESENSKKKPYGFDAICKFYPECWISYQCYLKFYNDLELEHCFDYANDSVLKSSNFIKNNFLTVENCFSGIFLPKALNYARAMDPKCYYNHKRQLHFFYKNLDNKFMSNYKKIFFNLKYEVGKVYQQRLKDLMLLYIVRNYAKPINLKSMQEEAISEESLSFVVTGRIDKKAIKNIKRLRKNYPKSKIILSLEDGVDVSSLYGFYDDVVFKKLDKDYFLDANCHKDNSYYKQFTFNKQQSEVYNGLNRVCTRFAVRLRADFYVKNKNLARTYERYVKFFSKSLENYHFFDGKILVPSVITGCESKSPFYLSDLFAIGLTDDLKKLYNGSHVNEYSLNFFKKNENQNLKNPANFSHQYANEQTFFFNFLKMNNISFDYPKTYCDYTTDQALSFNKILANNFIVLPFDLLRIQNKFPREWGLPFSKFVELYMTNVDPKNLKFDNILLKLREKEYLDEKLFKIKNKIKKRICFLIYPIKETLIWMVNLIKISFCVVKFIYVFIRLLFHRIL